MADSISGLRPNSAAQPDPLGHVKVGDPRPWNGYATPICEAHGPDGYFCTRWAGHEPWQHIATGNIVVAVWPADSKVGA